MSNLCENFTYSRHLSSVHCRATQDSLGKYQNEPCRGRLVGLSR